MGGRSDSDRLQSEIHELLSDLWQIPRIAGLRQGFRPQVDCYRTADPPELTIVVDLAGVSTGDVRVLAVDRALVIEGERPRPRLAHVSYQQLEIDYGPFRRRVELPPEADAERAVATYDRGVLRISVPVGSKPKARERVVIPVQARP